MLCVKLRNLEKHTASPRRKDHGILKVSSVWSAHCEVTVKLQQQFIACLFPEAVKVKHYYTANNVDVKPAFSHCACVGSLQELCFPQQSAVHAGLG